MAEFKLPDLGEGVTEAEIDRWLVKEGDRIAEDEPLVEVITDKATAEIPSPFAGVVVRIHVPEGEVAAVGAVLVTIGEDATEAVKPVEAAPDRQGIKAMPPVRKLARELGVDLATVTPTGPHNSVTRADVEAAAGRSPQTEPAPTAARADARPEARREPLRGIRRTIAQRMTESHRIVPPVTHVEECDVTELDATRRLMAARRSDGPRLTYLPFIVSAVVSALKSFPALNASLDEEASEIVLHSSYDIGIAVDTEAGLSVPVIKDAEQKSIGELAADIERLAGAARTGTLTTEDLRGGTFTVTSPGRYGGVMATPLVFHPQAAILGVHRAVDRPVVRDGQIVVRKVMNLSVTFDHRILDGLTAAKFALEVTELLEHPALLALES